MPRNKTDNFLKAIKKYAKEQKDAMEGEVKQLKTERLQEAEEKAKRDSERMKKERLNETHSRQTALIAAKTQESRRKLFTVRAGMTDEVFRLAKEKLLAYVASGEYAGKLQSSAQAIAALFGSNDCVLYVNPRDVEAAAQLQAFFDGNTEVKADKTIQIGGIRGYCPPMRIIADETLDTKLEAQRAWFIENAALSVL